LPFGLLAALALLPFAPSAALGLGLGTWLASRAPARPLASAWPRRKARGGRDDDPTRLAVGRGADGRLVSIPLRDDSGAHALIVGATGAGKTVSETWILVQAIRRGFGAVVVDPKGDALLRESLSDAAERAGRRFLEWTPAGPCVYNPFGHGSPGEIADKALAGEHYSEPHYLRQAQRYLGQAARVIAAQGETATLACLLALMDPRELELAARSLDDEDEARDLFSYLDSLDPRQRAGLVGTRDRLAILVESEFGRWLDPAITGAPQLDLLAATRERAIVYFDLDADRLPLLAAMLGAAIVQDLQTVAAAAQHAPLPTVIAIDEFAALGIDNVARLFARARSAAITMLLATQELNSLGAGSGPLAKLVLGNVETVIAHRQNVPESAEAIAQLAGTRSGWVRTEHFVHSWRTGRGSRREVRELRIEPETITTLAPGAALVWSAGGGDAAVTQMFAPWADA
jgi:type IV secretory pathway TraG/TraD family ATPase VirD4